MNLIPIRDLINQLYHIDEEISYHKDDSDEHLQHAHVLLKSAIHCLFRYGVRDLLDKAEKRDEVLD